MLQDQGPQIPFDKIKIVYEDDFKCKLEDVFSEFDHKAIAAASLAQVHKAKIRGSDEVVAVKL